MPAEVTKLSSFVELLSWAMGSYATHGGPGNFFEVKDADTGRSKEIGKVPINYDGCPSHVHAQWFVRMGLAGVTDYQQARRAHGGTAYNRGGDVNDWVTGEGHKLRSFDAFCRAAHIPEDVQKYMKSRHGDFRREFTFPVSFNAKAVRAAIEATTGKAWDIDGAGAEPTPVVLKPVGTAPALDLASRLRLTVNGQHRTPRVSGGHLQLGRGGTSSSTVLIALDGSLIGHQSGHELHLARINRVRGALVEWIDAVDLAVLGDGDVLAIGPAGPAGVALVWATDRGTELIVVPRPSEQPRPVATLSPRRATSAVLRGLQALLAAPSDDGAAHECNAFDEVDITAMTAASSAGRTVVLATGLDSNGRPGAWVEADGRAVWQAPDPSISLRCDLGTRHPPAVVTPNGEPAQPPADIATSDPYEHWVSAASTRTRATA